MVFASLNLLPNTPSLLRGDVLLRVIRPCTQSYVGLVIFAQEDYGAVSRWGMVTRCRNKGMLHVHLQTSTGLAHRFGWGDVRAGGTRGLSSSTNCLGPGGSEDNGWSIWSLLLLRFSASWEQGWQQLPWGWRTWRGLHSPSFLGHKQGTRKSL